MHELVEPIVDLANSIWYWLKFFLIQRSFPFLGNIFCSSSAVVMRTLDLRVETRSSGEKEPVKVIGELEGPSESR